VPEVGLRFYNRPMDDLPDLAELHEQTQQSRFDFLKMELRTCFSAIDFGNIVLEQGDRDYAAKEIRGAEKGYTTILRFLPGLDGGKRYNEIEAALPPLRKPSMHCATN